MGYKTEGSLLIGAALFVTAASVHALTRNLWTFPTFDIPKISISQRRRPKKKALLIGINYVGCDEQGAEGALVGPQGDVIAMKQLLIDTYHYEEDDIVVMIDREEYGNLQPTQANLLRELKSFITDPQPGDRYFFHYSGHSSQTPCENVGEDAMSGQFSGSTRIERRNNSEEDGMDECLIPSDDTLKDPKIITDNTLRRYLVDSLPVGSSLVAIFDSCHSASLLDLEHFRCNRVFVPWLSKGKRRSDSLWNATVRRQAIATSRRVHEGHRLTSKKVKSKMTSIDQVLHQSSNRSSVTAQTSSEKPSLEHWYGSPSSPIHRSASPVSMWPCDGFCPAKNSDNKADVISLGACKDDQTSWEDTNGHSMTAALISILRDDPHPVLRDLMARVSHRLHDLSLQIHQDSRRYKKELKKWQADTGSALPNSSSDEAGLEMNNFQDPQLASHKPLDMDARWAL